MDTSDISRLWIQYEGKGLVGIFDFAKIVAQKASEEEREACAKLCESRVPPDARHGTTDVEDESRACADVIRMRSNA